MYYTQLSLEENTHVLAEFLAARMTTQLKAVIVSQDPESLMELFESAWIEQTRLLINQRDLESDISYMSFLTSMITLMQQSGAAFSEGGSRQRFLFAHPYEVDGHTWSDRQLLICADKLSAQTCLQLMDVVTSDFQLIVLPDRLPKRLQQKIEEGNIQPVVQAETKMKRLITKLEELASDLGIQPDNVQLSDVTNVEELGGLVSAENTDSYNKIIATQKQIAAMRTIVGRVQSSRDVSEESLHGLKVIVSHIDELHHPNQQLFDDPYDLQWIKLRVKFELTPI